MKIAIVINTSWNIYNFRMGLVDFFRSKGLEVIAIAPKDEFTEELAKKITYYPIQMEQKGTNPLSDLFLIFRLYRLYKQVSPDCILHYTIKPNIYGTFAASLAGIPCINNVSGLGTVFLHDSFSTRIAKVLYRLAFCFPKKVFFQNQEDLALFIQKKLVKYDKTDVLPGSGVDLQYFQFEKLPDSKPFTFLVIARLLYDKGILEYAEAAALLKKKYPSIRFVLAGSLDSNPKLGIPKALVDSWSQSLNIDYVGFASGIKSLISNAHCVVLPSYREGTPRSLLEASAMGRPIVATDVPGCREVAINGYNGFLCKSGNAIDLAAKMEAILQLSPEALCQMGQNSRNLVEEKFNEQIVFSKYFEALNVCKP
jgi:glycosyltransferase involved in cell wall biosynthesis